ncbi:MAG TPA: hypothetical protein VG754_03320, partial [Verrucomicrobiae bacterium]|nr:hypothetical protein [Verrucomicrobiae bacterium]
MTDIFLRNRNSLVSPRDILYQYSMTGEILELPLNPTAPRVRHVRMADFASELAGFREFGT